MLEKLTLVYESCKIYELSKLYQLCKLCEYLMNYLKSLQIAWNQSKKVTWFVLNIIILFSNFFKKLFLKKLEKRKYWDEILK